jgi:hypothetical protein
MEKPGQGRRLEAWIASIHALHAARAPKRNAKRQAPERNDSIAAAR